MIMCDYCALSPDQRKQMLSIFKKILKPDGSILFDVYSLASFAKREESAVYGENLLNGFWSPKKYYCFLNTFKYEKEKVVLDKYTIIEPNRNRLVYNWLQYFSPETLQKEVQENGFIIEKILSDVAGLKFSPLNKEFAVIVKNAI